MGNIYAYAASQNDCSTIGLVGALLPSSCAFQLEAGGFGELTMEHPKDDYGKWKALAAGVILKAPVPVRLCPDIMANGTYITTVETWKISSTAASSARALYKTATGDKKTTTLPAGQSVTVICENFEASRTKIKCTVSTKKKKKTIKTNYTGWVATSVLDSKVSEQTIPATSSGAEDADASYAIRDQLFRIYSVETTDDMGGTVTVKARRIVYDLLGNVCTYSNTGTVTGLAACQGILANTVSSHDFSIYSDIGDTRTGIDCRDLNPIEALVAEEDGVMDRWSGEVVSDDYDIYMLHQAGMDRGVRLSYAKNIKGINCKTDVSSVALGVRPHGEWKDGSPLYLKGSETLPSGYSFGSGGVIYANSTKDDSAIPKILALEVNDAQMNDDVNEALARQRLVNAAVEKFEAGCNQPTITLDVDFVMLGDTEEYEQYQHLESLFVYDTVHIYYEPLGIASDIALTTLVWDCVSERVTEAKFGALESVSASVSSWQISSVSGSKIASGTVSGAALKDDIVCARLIQADAINADALQANSVTAGKIAAGAVTATNLDATTVNAAYAHLTDGVIDNADIDAANIQNMDANYAHITDGVIDNAKIDAADIQNMDANYAHITDGVIDNATIAAAKVNDLDAKVATLVEADIGEANIGYAQIKDASVEQLISHDAIGDRYYIDKLQVSNAQMVEATVGTLVIKASDGKYYQLDVDTDTYSLTTTEVSPTDSEISAGETESGRSIIDTSLTATDLAATNLKAINALVDKITAERIDADKLFARQAVIDAITTSQIISENLNVTASKILIGYDESGEEVWSTVSDNIDDTSEKITEAKNSIESLNGDQDKLEGRVTTNENDITTYKTWVEINSDTETVYVGSKKQDYRARVNSQGFHIDQKDVDEYNEISAFIENTLTVEKIQLGRVLDSAPEEGDTRITMKPSSDGGLMWVPEAIKGYVKK